MRSHLVRSFLRRPGNLAIRRGLRPATLPGWELTLRALHRANLTYGPRRSVDPVGLARLRREFEPEIERTARLIGRDLSAWVDSDASATPRERTA